MLTAIDWMIIGCYVVMMVAVGIACRGRQGDSADYFIAHGGLGGVFGSIIVGLSIAATFFSGITFIAYPAIVYQRGLLVLMGIPTLLLSWVVLRFIFLPRYLAGGWRQPYEVLEARYGPGVRTTAAGFFVLLRIGWMATLIYAPTVALMAATGLDEKWFWPIILAVGLSSTLYTVFGGIRGVIVTDAIQMIIIMAGIALTVIFAVAKLPVPVSDAVQHLASEGRLEWWEPSLSLTTPLTFWAVTIGMTLNNLGSYIGDQMSLQRYLTANSLAESSRSFLVNLVGVLIVLGLLAAVGVCMAAWYELRPPAVMPSPDQAFPAFIANELPTGVRGLLLAALLAATMSSITSGINALAAAVTLDFRNRLIRRGRQSPRGDLAFARWTSLAIGLISTLSAGLVAHLGQLFDITQKLIGVFSAPLAILLLLAVLRVPVRGRVLIIGVLCGAAAGWIAALSPNLSRQWSLVPAIDSLWVSPITSVVMLIVCMLSWLIRRGNRGAAPAAAGLLRTGVAAEVGGEDG